MTWYQIEYTGRGTYRLRVRAWHPGFWLEAFRLIRSSGAGVFAGLYYTVILIAVMARRKR